MFSFAFYLNSIVTSRHVLQILIRWMLCLTHTHTFTHPTSSQALANEQSFHYSALYGRLAERAIHWSVHLSLSCPLCLTVKINGKHPERTWTRRCISACQPMPTALATSIYLWCLENLMPVLDTECITVVGCQLNGTCCFQVVAKLLEIN